MTEWDAGYAAGLVVAVMSVAFGWLLAYMVLN